MVIYEPYNPYLSTDPLGAKVDDVTTQSYVMTDFEKLTEGTCFVLADEYGNSQDELPIGLEWQKIYEELSKSEFKSREMVKFHNMGRWLYAEGGRAVKLHEKVITGPPLRTLKQFGPDLPEDSAELLRRILAAGAFKVDSDKVISQPSLVLTLFDRPRTIPAFELGFITELAGRVSLTHLGVLRALQELDKRQNP